MARLMIAGNCIDVSDCDRTTEDDYLLEDFHPGMLYLDAQREAWIFSIGKHHESGLLVASRGVRFYKHPEFECVYRYDPKALAMADPV